MINKVKNVPKIRFSGYTHAWEKRKLGEIGSVVMNKRIFKNETLEFGEIPFYKIGTFGKQADAFISRELFEEYKDKYPYPKVGDILISASGTLGRTVVYNGEEAYYQDSNIVWLQQNNKIVNNSFLKQFYNIVKWGVSEGSTIKRLYNSNILSTKIIYPIISEQTKIGNFFQVLDNLLALHQRKCNMLKNLKKGYLQKMFPKGNEKTPEIRFRNFNGEWEEHRLGDVYAFSKGRGLPLDNFTENEESPSIAYGHLYTKYSEVIDSVKLSSTDQGVFSKYNDVLFPGSSTVPNGTAQANALMLDNIKLGGDIIIARELKNKVTHAPFTSYQINFQRTKLFSITVGSTITHMYGKDLAKLEFLFPEFKEQIKIGNLFQTLDQQINQQETKLKHLKQLKQAYLKNMFV